MVSSCFAEPIGRAFASNRLAARANSGTARTGCSSASSSLYTNPMAATRSRTPAASRYCSFAARATASCTSSVECCGRSAEAARIFSRNRAGFFSWYATNASRCKRRESARSSALTTEAKASNAIARTCFITARTVQRSLRPPLPSHSTAHRAGSAGGHRGPSARTLRRATPPVRGLRSPRS